jgi:hypothetical protein
MSCKQKNSSISGGQNKEDRRASDCKLPKDGHFTQSSKRIGTRASSCRCCEHPGEELPHEVDPRQNGRISHFVIPFARAQGARVLTDTAAEALALSSKGIPSARWC